MSSDSADTGEFEPCCEFCGLPITDDDQTCSAIDDGTCKTTEEVLAESGGLS